MNIYTAYYRQKESRDSFLLLQQVRRVRDDANIILSFIADKREIFERLLVWFRGELLEYCKNTDTSGIEGAKQRIMAQLSGIKGEYAKAGFAGVLSIGGEYIGLGNGGYGIYTAGSMFLRDSLRVMLKGTSEEIELENGIISGNLGILICDNTYFEGAIEKMSDAELAGLLRAADDLSDLKVNRRFRELSEYIERGGGIRKGKMSAIYMAFCEEGHGK